MKTSHVEIKLPDDQFIRMEDFYPLVINSLQDYSIITTDRNLMINCWCAGSVKIFGYTPQEALGKHISLIFTEEDKADGVPQKDMVSALKEGKATDNRWHIGKDGKMFFAFGQMFPINDKNGNLVGFVKILRDLTAQKMAEDALSKKMHELEELINHKETILAILSHDLRSPLSSIIETTDYLKNSIDELERGDLKPMIDHLHRASTEELDMLDDLLEWARIKYAAEAFIPVKLNMRQCVKKVLESLNEFAANGNITLDNQVDPLTEVYADKKMLHSILHNLVSNGIKYTGPGGSITISASPRQEKVTVVVKDTGIGMSPEQLDKLFTPRLKTLSHTRKEDKGGGIGLLLVKGFLEKNHGEIWVESTPGQGSSFFFTLPASDTNVSTPTAEPIELGEGEG
jgi:two-component system CheB/CheR fusion protein